MSSKFHDIEKFRRPELFLAELLTRSARNELYDKSDNSRVLYRATVLAVDVVGGKIENPAGDGSITHVIEGRRVELKATIGPENPRNSVKARVITDGFDQFLGDDDVKVFWPLFSSHDTMPVKPGEHVYVMFEDKDFSHGLWLTKVSGHDTTNRHIGEKNFKSGDESRLAVAFGDAQPTQAPTDKIASDRLISDRLSKLF